MSQYGIGISFRNGVVDMDLNGFRIEIPMMIDNEKVCDGVGNEFVKYIKKLHGNKMFWTQDRCKSNVDENDLDTDRKSLNVI